MARLSLKNKHTRELLKLLEQTRPCCGITRLERLCVGYTAAEIKAELTTREHIPNKQEAKLVRQKQAKEKKNR